MTAFIVILCIALYAMAGLATGIYTRNRSVNKSFANRYAQEVESKQRYPNLYRFRYGEVAAEEELILRAMSESKTYDSPDWALAGFLGGFFWPAFLVGFGFHWTYEQIGSLLQPHMPISEAEKKVKAIHKARDLEAQRLEMIKIGRKLNLDVKQLEKLKD